MDTKNQSKSDSTLPDAGARTDGTVVPCPHCRRQIPEETIRCPHCHEWIIDRPSNESQRSPWFWPIIIAIGLVMILVVLAIRLSSR